MVIKSVFLERLIDCIGIQSAGSFNGIFHYLNRMVPHPYILIDGCDVAFSHLSNSDWGVVWPIPGQPSKAGLQNISLLTPLQDRHPRHSRPRKKAPLWLHTPFWV